MHCFNVDQQKLQKNSLQICRKSLQRQQIKHLKNRKAKDLQNQLVAPHFATRSFVAIAFQTLF
jgi:hypothetical protein